LKQSQRLFATQTDEQRFSEQNTRKKQETKKIVLYFCFVDKIVYSGSRLMLLLCDRGKMITLDE
jgi:hypothetical protein